MYKIKDYMAIERKNYYRDFFVFWISFPFLILLILLDFTINRVQIFLKKIVPPLWEADTGFFLIIQGAFMLIACIRGYENICFSFQTVFFFFCSLVSTALFVRMLGMLSGKNKKAKRTILYIFFLFWILLYAYHYNTKVPFDFSSAFDNAADLKYWEAWKTVRTSLDKISLMVAATIFIVAVSIERRTKIFSLTIIEENRFAKFFSALVLYIVFFGTASGSYDDFAYLIRSGYERLRYDHNPVLYQEGQYPFWNNQTPAQSIDNGDQPDIILVIVESFNALYIEKITSQGKEVTPETNKLIKKGLYLDKFYGNSVQTAKGHLATLFSIIPSQRGIVFSFFSELRIKSIADVMLENGYDTLFIQAYKNIEYNNTANFLTNRGFNSVESVVPRLNEKEADNVWGWGPEDSIFYKKALERLDERKHENGGKPIFAVLTTISNHMRFNEVPDNKRFLFPEPENFSERFMNSIFISDRALGELYAKLSTSGRLKNTLLVITGDHSFPTGEHGIIHNESGCWYEESYRVPFMAFMEGRIKPRRISGMAFSQIDIAPTILDIAGIDSSGDQFEGRSILHIIDNSEKNDPVPLVQPYNGRWLGAVDYPWKYFIQKRTEQERLYNLAEDPGETINLINSVDPGIIKHLRQTISRIELNQAMIERDSFVPFSGRVP